MDKDEKLTITAGDVLRAAEKCGTAKEVLKEMFPKVFGDEWEDVTKAAEFDWGWSENREIIICINRKDRQGRDCIGLNKDGTWDIFPAGSLRVKSGKIWRKRA